MAGSYSSEDKLVRDYAKLNPEYQNKVGQYIKNLLKIQRIETGANAQILKLERAKKAQILSTNKEVKVFYCHFCSISQDDAEYLIAGPDNVFICDACARLCGEVLDEAEAKSREEADRAEAGKAGE